MFFLRERIDPRRVAAACVLLAGTLLNVNSHAAGLSLQAAEELALESDPGVQSVEANQIALRELSVAADQWPDPMVKMGLMSLPMDTFNLGQEAMTQVQLGLVQRFPRGNSRALRSEQIDLKAEGLGDMARDQELQITLAVSEQFLEVLKQQELARINSEAIRAFSDVEQITRDYYATGRAYQHDVLQAAVELAKAEERAERIAQDEDQARSRLATWIGDAAWRDFEPDWPDLGTPQPGETIKKGLMNHPRIQGLQKSISAAETGVELARQRYKPEFALDVTYGGRGGTNPNGSSRPDLLSMMVVMDVPIFRKNRQDRVVAAQVAESSAAMYTRDDVLRRMRSDVDFNSAVYRKLTERITLFEENLLPDASFSSEASLEAYQSSVEDLTTLLRTQITEFELQLEHARLQAELLKTQARLRYFEGVRS